MNITDLIKNELIFYPSNRLKNEILDEIVDGLYLQNLIDNPKNIKEQIAIRESLMSTGIGLSIGVPHVRMDEIKNPIIAVAISKTGIINYSSMDNQPVKLVFMILVNKSAHKEYIKLLSQIVKKMKDDKIRNALIESTNSIDAYKILMQQELHA